MKKLLLSLVVFAFAAPVSARVVVGAGRMGEYLPMLEGRRVGVVTNHTGVLDGRHLVDTLLARGVRIEAIFAPEHGFRGTAVAGEHVDDSRDAATGLPVISLYGANRKPRAADFKRYDVIVFDIQDVGCRFYTYLSTMYYVMETCAETGVPLVVLDRPNPNGMYVDGPILDVSKHRSFVGMLPVPVVHGMTLGELARMINGEGWLAGGVQCELTVVACEDYKRDMRYVLPVAPSPGLPNMRAVLLYPSLCYFEATKVDLGRGGEASFQLLTYPDGTTVDLRSAPSDDAVISGGIDLKYLTEAFRAIGGGEKFLSSFFELLMGVDWVRPMIEAGRPAAEIEARWADDVARFTEQRRPYLIYE
ncbi:MAG: DUF1343 domain-containing protein [Alistipes sp.]|jgi:uncharacterized protein YbbC (DUF1343 family)|nr:DUF1343 domain-containing protein [Alistipes sp.]